MSVGYIVIVVCIFFVVYIVGNSEMVSNSKVDIVIVFIVVMNIDD